MGEAINNMTVAEREKELGAFIKSLLRIAESSKFYGEHVIRIKFRDGKLCTGFESETRQTHKYSK